MIFEKIKQQCKEHEISVAQLEKKLELGKGTISKWEKVSPSVCNLKKVSDYFAVSLDYFFE